MQREARIVEKDGLRDGLEDVMGVREGRDGWARDGGSLYLFARSASPVMTPSTSPNARSKPTQCTWQPTACEVSKPIVPLMASDDDNTAPRLA